MNCSLGVQSLFGSHWEASEVWRTLSFILVSYTILKTVNLFVHTCGDRYLFSLLSKLMGSQQKGTIVLVSIILLRRKIAHLGLVPPLMFVRETAYSRLRSSLPDSKSKGVYSIT